MATMETPDEQLERQMREQGERLAEPATEFGEPWNDEAPGAAQPPLVLEGRGQLSFDVGGKEPTSSHLTLTGGQIEVAGSYDKGDEIVLTVRLVVQEVAFRDEIDRKTGQVVGAKRKHKARITRVDETTE